MSVSRDQRGHGYLTNTRFLLTLCGVCHLRTALRAKLCSRGEFLLAARAFLLFLRGTAFRAEFCSFAKLCSALDARHFDDLDLRAAFSAEFRGSSVRFTALGTGNGCRDRSSACRCGLAAGLIHPKCIRHLAADCKARSEAGTEPGTAAFVLGGISQRVRRLELHIFLSVAESTHRRTLVHRGLDLFGK